MSGTAARRRTKLMACLWTGSAWLLAYTRMFASTVALIEGHRARRGATPCLRGRSMGDLDPSRSTSNRAHEQDDPPALGATLPATPTQVGPCSCRHPGSGVCAPLRR